MKGRPLLRDTTESLGGTGTDIVQGGNVGETPPQGQDPTEGPGAPEPARGKASCPGVVLPTQHKDEGALAGARPLQQSWFIRGQLS